VNQAKNEDDLTLIKGIGQVRQQWLREHLHVHRFQQLAALDPVEVEKLLSQEKAASSVKEIARWIKEAGELALQAPALPANGNGHDCKSLATFIVDYLTYSSEDGGQQFKTLVTQMDVETDTAISEEWVSLEQRKPCEWMQQRLEEVLASQDIPYGQVPLPEVDDTFESDLPVTRLHVRILGYHLHWPAGSLSMDPPFEQEKLVTLEQASPFNLDIRFVLEGMPDGYSKGLGYHAACHIIPIGSQRETVCLQGDRQRHLKAGQTAGVAYLEALHLPLGNYEVWLSVKPDAADSRPDLVKGPRIMVM
jgi:hypothetical protein